MTAITARLSGGDGFGPVGGEVRQPAQFLFVCFKLGGRIACFHQFQVHQQASSTAIAVDKGVYALKVNEESI